MKTVFYWIMSGTYGLFSGVGMAVIFGRLAVPVAIVLGTLYVLSGELAFHSGDEPEETANPVANEKD